ncbi:AcrR family transcriptional regulator [Paenibacillus sp. V4I3]|uniref:TetR/AcrR family transcriptional regulator n=1 Tax=unclassified Paenibacillus TaxID=185978 RepID=UPI00278383AA|nr:MULTISPECIES: TetR/AcrR family transcriptional regulator [unclassified Paenibacillus]MDQ0872714.1 AcrR family transcriptional regulator [Paenibacillus sp. V4I3]MDQ0891368.1 AcrR family transcriptional regulator [Paenibacillus sp. V4I9]
MDKKESARLEYVLETALNIFARYGYKKTSIEDISKAAGITRQGIYLHFKNKEEILKASIQKALDDGLQAVDQILENDSLMLEKKLFQALDEWFGRHVGFLHPEASDLAAQCERVLGDAVENSSSSFQKKLEQVILASSGKQTKDAETHAATIADMLCTCALTWKHRLSSRQEFQEKLCGAIHLCCQNLRD